MYQIPRYGVPAAKDENWVLWGKSGAVRSMRYANDRRQLRNAYRRMRQQFSLLLSELF